MRYTSIENIHKVIDQLFLDGLKKEFEEIEVLPVQKTRQRKPEEFQKKLGMLTLLDIILQSLIQSRGKSKRASLRYNFCLRCRMCAGLIGVDLFTIL